MKRRRSPSLYRTSDPGRAKKASILRLFLVFLSIYVFIISIKLLGSGFKDMGEGFSEGLLQTVKNPLSGLFIGIVATAIIQSSSTTTSITVGMVASGTLPIEYAIPMIIGANVGTTITNTLVSLGHISRKQEFKRAFTAATVHDMFNLCAAFLFFGVEQITRITMGTGLIHYISSFFSKGLGLGSDLCLVKPLEIIITPLKDLIHHGIIELAGGEGLFSGILAMALAIVMLVISLRTITSTVRKLSGGRMQRVIDTFLFRSNASAFGVGVGLTSVVQSSSVTTSFVVPLAGAGMVKLDRVYAYSLGANIGTTITTFMAALACSTGHKAAVTVALVHLIFNIFGIMVFYPLRRIPMTMAETLAENAVERKWLILVFIGLVFFILPLCLIFILR